MVATATMATTDGIFSPAHTTMNVADDDNGYDVVYDMNDGYDEATGCSRGRCRSAKSITIIGLALMALAVAVTVPLYLRSNRPNGGTLSDQASASESPGSFVAVTADSVEGLGKDSRPSKGEGKGRGKAHANGIVYHNHSPVWSPGADVHNVAIPTPAAAGNHHNHGHHHHGESIPGPPSVATSPTTMPTFLRIRQSDGFPIVIAENSLQFIGSDLLDVILRTQPAPMGMLAISGFPEGSVVSYTDASDNTNTIHVGVNGYTVRLQADDVRRIFTAVNTLQLMTGPVDNNEFQLEVDVTHGSDPSASQIVPVTFKVLSLTDSAMVETGNIVVAEGSSAILRVNLADSSYPDGSEIQQLQFQVASDSTGAPIGTLRLPSHVNLHGIAIQGLGSGMYVVDGSGSTPEAVNLVLSKGLVFQPRSGAVGFFPQGIVITAISSSLAPGNNETLSTDGDVDMPIETDVTLVAVSITPSLMPIPTNTIPMPPTIRDHTALPLEPTNSIPSLPPGNTSGAISITAGANKTIGAEIVDIISATMPESIAAITITGFPVGTVLGYIDGNGNNVTTTTDQNSLGVLFSNPMLGGLLQKLQSLRIANTTTQNNGNFTLVVTVTAKDDHAIARSFAVNVDILSTVDVPVVEVEKVTLTEDPTASPTASPTTSPTTSPIPPQPSTTSPVTPQPSNQASASNFASSRPSETEPPLKTITPRSQSPSLAPSAVPIRHLVSAAPSSQPSLKVPPPIQTSFPTKMPVTSTPTKATTANSTTLPRVIIIAEDMPAPIGEDILNLFDADAISLIQSSTDTAVGSVTITGFPPGAVVGYIDGDGQDLTVTVVEKGTALNIQDDGPVSLLLQLASLTVTSAPNISGDFELQVSVSNVADPSQVKIFRLGYAIAVADVPTMVVPSEHPSSAPRTPQHSTDTPTFLKVSVGAPDSIAVFAGISKLIGGTILEVVHGTNSTSIGSIRVAGFLPGTTVEYADVTGQTVTTVIDESDLQVRFGGLDLDGVFARVSSLKITAPKNSNEVFELKVVVQHASDPSVTQALSLFVQVLPMADENDGQPPSVPMVAANNFMILPSIPPSSMPTRPQHGSKEPTFLKANIAAPDSIVVSAGTPKLIGGTILEVVRRTNPTSIGSIRVTGFLAGTSVEYTDTTGQTVTMVVEGSGLLVRFGGIDIDSVFGRLSSLTLTTPRNGKENFELEITVQHADDPSVTQTVLLSVRVLPAADDSEDQAPTVNPTTHSQQDQQARKKNQKS